jgi:hypothetical protein
MGTKGTGRIDSCSRGDCNAKKDKSELSALIEMLEARNDEWAVSMLNYLQHPVKGINTMCANMMDHPIAAGAMLPARMFFL